jgi:hypothetical protein
MPLFSGEQRHGVYPENHGAVPDVDLLRGAPSDDQPQ